MPIRNGTLRHEDLHFPEAIRRDVALDDRCAVGVCPRCHRARLLGKDHTMVEHPTALGSVCAGSGQQALVGVRWYAHVTPADYLKIFDPPAEMVDG